MVFQSFNYILFADQSFDNIVLHNRDRVRNYLLRNGLYWNFDLGLIHHIRRHYRIADTNEDRARIHGS